MNKSTRKKAATKPKDKTTRPAYEILEGLLKQTQAECQRQENVIDLMGKEIVRKRGQIVQLEREVATLAREASKLANIAEAATAAAMQAADSLLVVSNDRLGGVRAEIKKSQQAIDKTKALRGTNGECEPCDTAGFTAQEVVAGGAETQETYSGAAVTTLYRGC